MHLAEKAAGSLEEREEALTSFNEGALAAYEEAEAFAPPPEPVQPEVVAEPAAAAAAIDEAMTAAPATGRAASANIMPSPGVLFMQAARGAAQLVGMSPRVATTASSPARAAAPAPAASPSRPAAA